MKKISLLIAITFLLVSCGSKIDNNESFYIPKDAIGVMYVNVKSLSEKSADLDFKNLNFNTLIENNAPSEIKGFLNELMSTENIEKTFRKEYIFGFGSLKRMSGFGGLVLPIKDAASFESFIQPVLEKIPGGLDKEEKVGKDNAFTIYSTRELAIGWNGKTALIIAAKSHAGTELKDLTALDEDKTIIATDYYSDFFNPKKDIGFHLTTDALGSTLNGLVSMSTGMNLNIENNYLTYYTSFEDDHIHALSNLKLNDDIKSLIGYEEWMSESFEDDLLNVIPKDILVLAKLSIDPGNLHDHLKSLHSNKVLSSSMREEMKEGFERANAEMTREIGMGTEELATVFKGSMVFALSEGITYKDTVYDYYNSYYRKDNDKEISYTVVDKKMPFMYGAIAIGNKDNFEKLFNKMLEESPMEKVGENHYQVDRNTQVVYNNETLFITNDVKKATEISKNGKLANNLSSFEHKSKLSHTLYVYSKDNLSSLTETMNGFINPYSRYSKPNPLDNISEKSAAIYEKYFSENHFYMDTDGTEGHTYTKGDKNSLVQTILYADELTKVMTEVVTEAVNMPSSPNSTKDEEDELIEEVEEELIGEVEEAIIESTEIN